MLETGLLSFKNHYWELDSGYYYIDGTPFLLALMYLCRTKNPEQPRDISPGEFGKLLGLDRIPEAKEKGVTQRKKRSNNSRKHHLPW